MGARVYVPSIGRFLQVDPIEGGTDNNYVYPGDPVNDFDLDGTFSFKKLAKAVTAVATVASFIPGPIGMVASGVAVAGNLAQGNYKAAALASVGLLGGIGGVAAIAAKGASAVKGGAGIARGLNATANAIHGSKVFQKTVGMQANLKVVGKHSYFFGTGRTTLLNNLGKKLNLSGPLKTFRVGWSKEGGRSVFRMSSSMNHKAIWSIRTGRLF